METRGEAYKAAVQMLRACATPDGFTASTLDHTNYRRIWGRDGAICGLAALLTDDPELVNTCRRTLDTLAKNQGPHGEIPSNVDTRTGRISYGGTTGRVDANLWFMVCCGEYYRRTGDDEFLESIMETLKKVLALLGAWEFNNRGLLYVPPTGDWADEYVQSGYVLYDQLLYYVAQQQYAALEEALNGSVDRTLKTKITHLKHTVVDNYWFDHGKEDVPDFVYHEVMYRKAREAAPRRQGAYWMPFFSPLGYGYRFDAMANTLVSLFRIADEQQGKELDDYIAGNVIDPEVRMLPAFLPIITPKDEAWDELQMTFSHTFKNQPYEYHNGGLWPLITGLYAAGLARRGKLDEALTYRDAAARACRSEGGDWIFPEFLNGQTLEPGGTTHMGWSAAALIIADRFIEGDCLACTA